jgi:ankyrin repeat protein
MKLGTEIKSRNSDFRLACWDGNLKLAKRLLLENPTINISSRNDFAFMCACRNGYLDIVKWLLTIKPNINIIKNEYQAFISSCSYGKLDVAKYLLGIIKPKMHSSVFEWAIKHSLHNGNLEVAKWLEHFIKVSEWVKQLKPYLEEKFIIRKVNIRRQHKIKKYNNLEKKKNRDLLVALKMADKEPDNSNTLFKLPTDKSMYLTMII